MKATFIADRRPTPAHIVYEPFLVSHVTSMDKERNVHVTSNNFSVEEGHGQAGMHHRATESCSAPRKQEKVAGDGRPCALLTCISLGNNNSAAALC
jgi:hypothetical protein